jgi:opacity protein-like surface antigen
MRRWLILGLVLLVLGPGIAQAQSDEWEVTFSPFLWGSGMSGTVGIAGQEGDFEASAKDLIKQLDFAFMANFEARKSGWSFGIDFDYTDLGKDVTVENPNVAAQNPRLDMKMVIVEGHFGYQVANSLDLLAGVRRVNATAGIASDASSGQEVDGGFTDPIVGLQLRPYLSEKLWLNIRGDIGGFGAGSDFSWFLGAAAGYRVSNLISLDFGYRMWDFDYKSDDELKRLDLTLGGFGGGLTFHF